MKLVFAEGKSPQSLPQQGVQRIGSDPDADIVLQTPGILPQHCELHVSSQGVMLHIARGAAVTVNQRAVEGLIALRPGDRIGFDRVEATLISGEPTPIKGRTVSAPANDDVGATMVRAALPKYGLRAQNGRILGKAYPLTGPTVIGRAPECQLRIDDASLSRKHAKLVPTNDGVVIEDLGSTNGSYHNGNRVQHAVAKPGDEIGFDTLRFRLFEVGQEENRTAEADPESYSRSIPAWLWAVGAAMVATVIVVVFVL